MLSLCWLGGGFYITLISCILKAILGFMETLINVYNLKVQALVELSLSTNVGQF